MYDIEFSTLSCYNKPDELNKNDFSFRIFSFRGLIRNDANNPAYILPYATSDNRNALGEIEPTWIPTMMNEEDFIARICSLFYRFMIWTEVVEFDAHLPPQEFYSVNPMRMGLVGDGTGVKNLFLSDRISFEPIRGVNQIFSKIKGYLYHKVFGLTDLEASTFQVYEQSEQEEMIYIGWRFVDKRWVEEPTGQAQLAKVQLLFFADPFLMNPKRISNLKVNYALEKKYSTGATLYDEKEITTGTNVIDYVSGEEYIFSNVGGGRMDVSVVVRESDDESYIPI